MIDRAYLEVGYHDILLEVDLPPELHMARQGVVWGEKCRPTCLGTLSRPGVHGDGGTGHSQNEKKGCTW